MKQLALSIALALLSAPSLLAQARDIPSAAPKQPTGETTDQRGRKALDQMLEALAAMPGFIAAMSANSVISPGSSAERPPASSCDFTTTRQFASNERPDAQRIGYIIDKSMILPGKKIDIRPDLGQRYPATKSPTRATPPSPKSRSKTTTAVRTTPSSPSIAHGSKLPASWSPTREAPWSSAAITERVSILSADNDAVTIDIDADTHLPRRRTFETRNPQFKDIDEDAEEYDDYHTIQGLPTAMTITRYHNGDMASQTFFSQSRVRRRP